jgi:hypothetical protein
VGSIVQCRLRVLCGDIERHNHLIKAVPFASTLRLQLIQQGGQPAWAIALHERCVSRTEVHDEGFAILARCPLCPFTEGGPAGQLGTPLADDRVRPRDEGAGLVREQQGSSQWQVPGDEQQPLGLGSPSLHISDDTRELLSLSS